MKLIVPSNDEKTLVMQKAKMIYQKANPRFSRVSSGRVAVAVLTGLLISEASMRQGSRIGCPSRAAWSTLVLG
jgi:hypothetical protein